MASPVLQFKRGLLANLPGLRAGEPGFTTDSYDLYVGLTSETSTNKFFGSHRYWTKETTTTGSGINLVEGTSNGSEYITIKSPDSLAGIVTYTLPGTQGATSSVLTNDGSGNLTWASGSADPVFSGIATFSDTTDNTLGDADTGAVQIDGGLGVNKNVTVGAGLSVAGESYFIGTATFYGGQINLGDSDTDDIVVAGEFKSSLIPSDDATYNLGSGDKRWNNVSFAGIATVVGTVKSNNFISTSTTVQAPTIGNFDGERLRLYDFDSPTNTNYAIGVEQNNIWFGVDNYADNQGFKWYGEETQVMRLGGTGNLTIEGNLSVNGTGISTFSGLIDANGGLDVLGHSELDNVNVSGIITASSIVFGSGTAITSVDTDLSSVSGSDDTLASAKAIKDYVDTQITAQDLDFAGDTGSGAVDLDSQSLTIAGTANEIETSASSQTITIGLPSNVIVGSALTVTDELTVGTGVGVTQFSSSVGSGNSTSSVPTSSAIIEYVRNSDFGLIGDSGSGSINMDHSLSILGTASEIETSVSGQTVTVGLPDNVIVGAALTVTGALDVNGGGTIDNIQIGVTDDNEIDTSSGNLTIDSAGGTVTIDDELIVSGDVRINGNDIKSSDGTTAITMSSANVTVGGDLTVGGSDIKASDGTTALTLVDTTGAVTTANDLTVTGNLYVSGNTTQVNTAALTVEDRTIDLGVVNGSTPSSATTWDLGVLFNYHSGGSAKKSAVVWEHTDTRFKFASVLSADTNGSDNDTPQLSVTTFAPIEIGSLWVTDCAGTSQVISCTGSTRNLENITIDAGTF